MRESLADSFAIVARRIPAALVPPSEREKLLRLARQLAPIHRAGFECRLTTARGGVELQQCITPRDAEPRRVAAFLREAGLSARPGWRRIHDFMLAWPLRGLDQHIIECWLEYEPANVGLAQPSLFLTLDRRAPPRDGVRALRRAFDLLAAPAAAHCLARAVRDVADRLPDDARIFDVGLMARRPAILRINVGGIRAAGLEAVLAALGWKRAAQKRIVEFARSVEPFAPQIKLALDWQRALRPGVALEIFPNENPGLGRATAELARWRGLLEWLHAHRYCDARRAAALVGWPGRDEPPACVAPWPESLVLESLVRGPAAFSVIDRRLAHLKVSFVPGRVPAAKAYFGYLRLWHGAPSAVSRPGGALRPRRAIMRGVESLLLRRSSRGLWRDFHAIRGGSDQWLSAYVAVALAGTGLRAAKRAARETWDLLAKTRAGPGWGYSGHSPCDADSTSWALRLAAALGRMREPPAQSALELVRRHRARDGGVACYLPENLGALRKRRVPRALAGWCGPHAEITAAAGALPGFAGSSAAWLCAAQQADGRWRAYWYDEDAFATALAAEHLADRPGRMSLRARARAAEWAASRVGADGSVSAVGTSGSAFAAACCLRILLCAADARGAREAIARVSAWLLAAQLADGSWRGSAPLREPLPGDRRPMAFGPRQGFAWDENGIFTTATALGALGRLAASKRRG